MGLSRQNVQRIADRLVIDGFLETSINPAHRRAKFYLLTSHGEEAMANVSIRQVKWANEISKGIERADLSKTVSVMTDPCERLEIWSEEISEENED